MTNIAKELIRVAHLLVSAKWSHTVWIKPSGKVVNIPTGNQTHWDWIAENFSELFPRHEFSDINVFDVPMQEGWIHIRNHGAMGITIRGKKSSIHKNRRVIIELIEDRMVEDDKFSFAIDYDSGKKDHKRGPYFDIPKELDRAKDAL